MTAHHFFGATPLVSNKTSNSAASLLAPAAYNAKKSRYRARNASRERCGRRASLVREGRRERGASPFVGGEEGEATLLGSSRSDDEGRRSEVGNESTCLTNASCPASRRVDCEMMSDKNFADAQR